MAYCSGKSNGFTTLDAIVVLCLAGILIGVVIPRYQRVTRAAQESALKAELSNIRTSINLFRVLNGRNPGSLRELIDKNVMLPARTGPNAYSGSIFKQKYLMPHAMDEEGNILDAFGNRFAYDPNNGGVRTTTRGYETW